MKVIMVGPPVPYQLLQAYEEDFSKLFKVKADFDTEVVRSERQDRQYAHFIAKLCREEGLPHFGVDAVAQVIRQGFRFADRHDRLSPRFSLVSDLIREAGYWARKENHAFVTCADVEAAVALQASSVEFGGAVDPGYLTGKFAGVHPFALSASLTFEQTVL